MADRFTFVCYAGYHKRWKELSTKLSSLKAAPYERASALAFVVERCQDMSKALLPDISKGRGRYLMSQFGYPGPLH